MFRNSSTDIHVLMPVRNAASFISSAISSVLNQTYKQTTLIIYDDASEDDTIKIIRSMSECSPRKIHLMQSNDWGGIAVGRNRLVEYSQNLNPDAAFLWLDCDDSFINERAIETIAKQMEKTQADICLYSFTMRWEDASAALNSNGLGAVEDKKKHDALLKHIVKTQGQTVSVATCPNILEATSLGWTKAYAASMKQKWVYPIENLLYEDFPSMSMLLNADKVTAISSDVPIVNYLRRLNSATGDRKPSHFTEDIPKQLERLITGIDIKDPIKKTAAFDFAARKMERYGHTLAALVQDQRSGFTQEILALYRTRVYDFSPMPST